MPKVVRRAHASATIAARTPKRTVVKTTIATEITASGNAKEGPPLASTYVPEKISVTIRPASQPARTNRRTRIRKKHDAEDPENGGHAR